MPGDRESAAAPGVGPVGLEPVCDPAGDDDLGAVFREGRGRVELLHVVAIGHRGLAEGPVVGLDGRVLLLAVVRGGNAQGLGQQAMTRTDPGLPSPPRTGFKLASLPLVEA